MALLLNPQLLLLVAAAIAAAFGVGYFDGRSDGKEIAGAACAQASVEASATANAAEGELRTQIRELEREASILRQVKQPQIQNFIQEVKSETPKVPVGVCDWPPSLVRKLNAAAEGRFVPNVDGGKAAVPAAGVPAEGRNGGIEVGSAGPGGR